MGLLVIVLCPFFALASMILKVRSMDFVADKFLTDWEIEEAFLFLGFVNNVTSLIIRERKNTAFRTMYTLLSAVYITEDELTAMQNNDEIQENADNERVYVVPLDDDEGSHWQRFKKMQKQNFSKKRGYSNDEIILKKMVLNELRMNRKLVSTWKGILFAFYLDEKPELLLKLFRGQKFNA